MTDNPDTQADLRSVFTGNLPDIFNALGICLIVSTYQAGKVILVRANGKSLNTHFRGFSRPMGIAVRPRRVSIGCRATVETYQNIPEAVARLDPPGLHDACYVPRAVAHTGAIDIHDMAWGRNNVLWGVNTRFSCLCTFDFDNSFVPRWRPQFISALAPEDRCHLNGLAMVNGHPGYVTALGKTDQAAGWRENKRDGGLLMDVARNRILVEKLSMPHSPRWHAGVLWMLESGRGSLVRLNLANGNRTEIARLPGFTRGLDFAGNLAFVGLSKVRETATFSDFPLLDELKERVCGVYVVDVDTGSLIGFVRFEGDVEEIFAVQVMQHRFPELLETDDDLLTSVYMVPSEVVRDFQMTDV
jgi:uncharacterized protein (TIGR03032 family)